MFKKAERLSRSDFLKYFKQGRRFHSDNLSLVFSTHTSLHVAVVVSKKVAKQATTRNLIRRRLYANLRTKLYKKHTGVYILVVKPSYPKLSKKAAVLELITLVERIAKPA